MDKKEVLEILKLINKGMSTTKEEQKDIDYVELIKALCICVASLLTKQSSIDPTLSVKENFEDYQKYIEKEIIVSALIETDYDIDKASEILDVSLYELETKIIELGITTDIMVFRVVFSGKEISTSILNNVQLDQFLEEIEKRFVIATLKQTNYNKIKAAAKLGISLRSMRYRFDKLSIDKSKSYFEIESELEFTEKYYLEPIRKTNLDQLLEEIEKKLITAALKETNYNKIKAAEKLGISLRTMRYRFDKLQII